MSKSKRKTTLTYSPGRKSNGTVRKEYINWRQIQSPPIPYRCDIEECIFHVTNLLWNGKELKLILDHINGVSGDNRPINLRFLCPNCNSQLPTHGGANKGKVKQASGGFSVMDKEGKKNHHLIADSANFKVKGLNAVLKIGKKST